MKTPRTGGTRIGAVRRSMTRRAVAVAAVGMLGATVATWATPASAASVTISFASLATYQPGMAQVVQDFAASQSNIAVQQNYYTAGTNYNTVVTTQFAGGNGTDLVYVGGGYGADGAYNFAADGYLLNLTKQPWVKNMFAGTKGLYSVGGKVYAQDIGIAPLALLSYNETLFSQAGLKVPTTFSQLLSLCQTIHAKGGVAISWGGAGQAINMNNTISLAGNDVLGADPHWISQALKGSTSFQKTKGWSTALTQDQEMFASNCFSPAMPAVAQTQEIDNFATGATYMLFTSPLLDGQVKALTPGIQIGIFNVPGIKASQSRLTVQPSGGFGINVKSGNVSADETFLNFLAQPKEQAKFATLNNIISPAEARRNSLPASYQALAPYFKKGTNLTLNGCLCSEWPNPQFSTVVGGAIQGLFTGQTNIQNVLETADQNLHPIP